MSYTLGQAAKAVGRSKTSILRSIKAGRISAGRDELGQWAIEPCELHRVYPPLTEDTDTGSGTGERAVTGGETALAEAHDALPWPKHGYPISKRCSTTSASSGTAGNSRRAGWRPLRSRINGRNPRPRSRSRGADGCEPRP